jgi:hypothetical protein
MDNYFFLLENQCVRVRDTGKKKGGVPVVRYFPENPEKSKASNLSR